MPWARRHPSEFLRDQWLAWLERTPEPSPYLLPEWSRFWESVWPDSRAELWVWTDADGRESCAIPLVRRRRFGLEMIYAQPNGTPSGPMGMDTIPDVGLFVNAMVSSRTVEIAISPDWTGCDLHGWNRQRQNPTTWILNIGEDNTVMESRYSESHRRNIVRGRDSHPRITELTSVDDVCRLHSAWRDQSRPSRLVLDHRRAVAFIRCFAATDAPCWRTAWVSDRPVATALFLVHRQMAVYVDGAIDRAPEHQGVNHLMFAETFARLQDEGVRIVDLGSGPGGYSDPGLDQFKRGWGAQPVTRTAAIYRRPWYERVRTLIRHGR